MIQKISYEFNDTLDSSLGYEVPGISIKISPDLPCDCLIDMELSLLTGEYVRNIVKNLEDIKNLKKDREMFGFEMNFIVVLKKGYIAPNGNSYPEGKVSIMYNYGDSELDTNLTVDDILQMMTDWRDYIDAWEKETGKIKK